MAVEHAPKAKRGFFGSFPQVGVPAGVILSNLVFLALPATLSDEQFASWGWRVPFLLSIVLVGVGLFIRLKIMESPMFARIKETNTEARMPILEVLRVYPKQVLLAAGAFIANNAIGYIVFAYILAYGTQALGLSRSTMLVSVLLAVVVMLFAVIGFASLSDRIGRRKVFLAGAVFCGLWAFPFFWLLETRNLALVLLAPAVMLVGVGALHGPQAALYSEMFGTRVRYSGASLGYSLGAVFGGGLAPFIATALFAATGGSWAISAYLVALCIVTFVSVLLISETYGTDMEEIPVEERLPATEAGTFRDRTIG
jgi:MFS family permease